MFKSLRKLFGSTETPPSAAMPEGERAYAIGDVHGRSDLLAALIAAVDADDAARAPARTTIIMLGDLVDRGPDSSGVIHQAREWQKRREVRILMGNHEEMFLDALVKNEVLRHFLRYGGKETLLSYPIDPEEYTRADIEETRALMNAAVPAADIEFVRSFEDRITLGDYLFVHAGIHPDAPVDQQRRHDLRWIREPFLSNTNDYGFVVVHGHTIFDAPDVRPNRIGIDTGAYDSGLLTALGLEGTSRWLVEAKAEHGGISISQRSI